MTDVKNPAIAEAVLNAKIEHMEKVGDVKYASFEALSATNTRVALGEEKIRGLEQRFNDHISSQRYMSATVISVASLVIAIIMGIVTLVPKFEFAGNRPDSQMIKPATMWSNA